MIWMEWVFPLVAGVVLGLFYFGGLWWTVGKLKSVERPATFYFLSLLIRSGVLLAAIYFLLGLGFKAVILTMLGLLVARMTLIRFQSRETAIDVNRRTA